MYLMPCLEMQIWGADWIIDGFLTCEEVETRGVEELDQLGCALMCFLATAR